MKQNSSIQSQLKLHQLLFRRPVDHRVHLQSDTLDAARAFDQANGNVMAHQKHHEHNRLLVLLRGGKERVPLWVQTPEGELTSEPGATAGGPDLAAARA